MRKIFLLLSLSLLSFGAMAETVVNITANKFVSKQIRADKGGAWLVSFASSDASYVFRFCYASPTMSGTYQLSQMNTEESYMFSWDAGGQVDYTTAQVTIAEENNGAVSLTGEVFCQETNTRYMLNVYEAGPLVAKDTVNLVLTDSVTLNKNTEMFKFGGKSANGYQAELWVESSFVAGQWDQSDMLTDYTGIVLPNGMVYNILQGTANVSQTGKSFHVDWGMICTDTVYYHITLDYTLPQPAQTYNMTWTTMQVDDGNMDYGMYAVYAENNTHQITIDVNRGSIVAGPMAADEMFVQIVDLADLSLVGSFVIDSATVSFDAAGMPVYRISMLGDDMNYYHLLVCYRTPVVTQTINFVDRGATFTNQIASSGLMAFYSTNNTYELTIALRANQIDGHYASSDGTVDAANTLVTNFLTEESYRVAEVNADVQQSGLSVCLTGYLITMSGIRFDLNLTADYAGMEHDATEGEVAVFYDKYDQLDLYDLSAEEGAIIVQFTKADRSNYTYMLFSVSSSDPVIGIPEGFYPINSSADEGTVLASAGVVNGDAYASYFGYLDAQGNTLSPLYFMETGLVRVQNKGGQLSVEVDARNSYGVRIVIAYDPARTALNDTQADGQAVKLIENGQVIILRNGVRYNTSGQAIQ